MTTISQRRNKFLSDIPLSESRLLHFPEIAAVLIKLCDFFKGLRGNAGHSLHNDSYPYAAVTLSQTESSRLLPDSSSAST